MCDYYDMLDDGCDCKSGKELETTRKITELQRANFATNVLAAVIAFAGGAVMVTLWAWSKL